MEEIGGPLRRKLADTRRWWRAMRLLGGLAWFVCVVVAAMLLCYHIDRAMPLSSSAREAWRLGIAAAGLLTLAIALLRLLTNRMPDTRLAAAVERRYPSLRERLLTTIDLTPALAAPEGAVSGPFSRAMAASLVEETNRAAADLDFRRAVDLHPLRTAVLCAVCILLLLAVDAAFAPQAFAVWLQRMARPHADIAPFASTRVWITPDADILPRGESAAVTVTTQGALPDRCVLRYRSDGDPAGAWKTLELTHPAPAGHAASVRTVSHSDAPPEAADTRRFRYRFPSLAQSLTLTASANDGRSNERRIVVEDRPTLLNVRLTLRYPAYMHRAAQTLPETTGNIAAPVGTEVAVQATANKPLRRADFVSDDAPVGHWKKTVAKMIAAGARSKGGDKDVDIIVQHIVPWKVSGAKAFGSLSVWKNGTYSLQLTDLHGFNNPAAPRYTVSAIPDQTPTVQILRPATDIDLVPDGSLPLTAHAADDYGVAAMRLVYNTLHGEDDTGKPASTAPAAHGAFALPGPDGKPQADAAVRWHIGSVHAHSGDTLRYEVDAVDNDTLRGPHVGRSLAYRVRVVSVPEMQRRMKEQLDEEARALEQLRARQVEAQKQLQDARQKPDRAALSRAQDSQRGVAQETRAVAQRVGELSAQLENNNLATHSELQRRDTAQKTLDTAAQQKMPAAADAVQRAETPQQRPSALTQAAQKENESRRDIEKAQELLARPPSAGRLAEQIEQLAQEQQRLADSARNLDEDMRSQRMQGAKGLTQDQRDNLKTERRQQAQTNADTRRVEKALEQAAQEAQERGEKAQADALRRASEALRKGNVAGNQQQAQQNLERNDPHSAAPNQDRAAAALQQAAEAAQKAAADESPESAQNAADRLERAAERLRQMADKQRQIASKVAQNPNSAQSRQLSKQENALNQQAGNMQQSLQDSAAAQQSLQSAQQNLSQSGQQLRQNSSQSARRPSQNAAQQLEKAAQQAANAAQQLKQQQAAQELQDRVDRLAQIQRALQSATHRLDPGNKNGTLNSTERRELNQVGERQQDAEQEAQRLARRFPSPAFQQALRMAAREMHPATNNLKKEPQDTSDETQTAQGNAAQTIETISQALKQQAQGAQSGDQQQGDQQQSSSSAQQAQQAAALGDLLLSRGLQAQVRQGTGTLDKARQRNQNQTLTKPQRTQANQLTEGQRTAKRVADTAAEELESMPEIQQQVNEATQHMSRAADQLNQKETGTPTQTHQDEALRRLDQAAKQVQQQMQQQQQQQQAQQQAQQGAPQPNQMHGNQPDRKAITRLEATRRGFTSAPTNRQGHGFAGLNPRANRVLHEGQQERVPAEFQDLVSRYYKSLAEKK